MTTYIASTSGGTMDGSSGNDVMIGKSGDDILDGGDGSDILLGGAGSDIIYYDEFDIKVDGGSGYDTLIFNGSGQTLNLGLQKTVMNFERIDLAGGGGHTLSFSAADVLRTSDLDALLIRGTSSSTVNFSDGGWVFQGYSGGQSRFVNGSAIVVIDNAVNVAGFSNNATLSVASGSVTSVTEDLNPDAQNRLVATGTVVVSDPNVGQAFLDLTGFDGQGTWGTLTLNANGSYTYVVSNAAINDWNNTRQETDVFNLRTVDGSVGSISFNIQGKNDAPAIIDGTFTMAIHERPAELNSDGTVKDNFYSANGFASVTDADNANQGEVFAHLVSVNGAYGDPGVPVTFIPDTQTFIVHWGVFFQESMFDHLKSGEQQTLTYTLSAVDMYGGKATHDVTVTVHGADDPIMGNGDANTLTGTAGNDLMSGLGGDDIITGLGGNDTIYGGDGNDIITGGTGVNHLMGGAGDDTYIIDVAGALETSAIEEAVGGGTDTVKVNASFSIETIANVENLSTAGPSTGVTLTGNSLNNIILGSNGNDIVYGLDGNDVFNGGTGNDTISGGNGNDTLYVSNGEIVAFTGGDGNDTVNVLDNNAFAKATITGGTGSDRYILPFRTEVMDLTISDFDIDNSDGVVDVFSVPFALSNVLLSKFDADTYRLGYNLGIGNFAEIARFDLSDGSSPDLSVQQLIALGCLTQFTGV